jgi:hypothetical protein
MDWKWVRGLLVAHVHIEDTFAEQGLESWTTRASFV